MTYLDYWIGFGSIIVAGILVYLLMGLLFRKSFLLTILRIFIVPLDGVALLGYTIGVFGLVHLSWAAVVATILIYCAIMVMKRALIEPVATINNIAKSLKDGDVSVKVEKQYIKGENEIASAMRSLDEFVGSLKEIVGFVDHVGKGDLEASIELNSDKDELSRALLTMRDNLREAEAEKLRRKEEDDRRNWTTEGLARFAALLRSNTENINELANVVISKLVKYVNANQGGLFMLNDEEGEQAHLEMLACYAYDRKKFIEKRIEIGDGLVGTCFLEKETIYMTDLPHNYINITSGLGDDTPRALLIVPLKLNDEVYGIIELASFQNFEPYVREFVEKIAESVASSISSVKTHLRTKKLLEMSKLQAEEMANQEEELRQNMEEMQATQEESARREEELATAIAQMEKVQEESNAAMRNMDKMFECINDTYCFMEFDTSGVITKVNENCLRILNLTEDAMIGVHMEAFTPEGSDLTYRQILAAMQQGEKISINTPTPDGTYEMHCLFIPYVDIQGELEKIMLMFYATTK